MAMSACCCIAANPIEQLAEKSNFLEVCYLLLNGELPTETESKDFELGGDAPHHAA